MAKPEWGIKRICPSCSTRYYDLRKDPPTCPACGVVYDPEALLKSRRARPIPAEEVKKPSVVRGGDLDIGGDEVVAEIEDADDDVAVDDLGEDEGEVADDEEEVLIEDASELGEDDVGEVVPVEADEEDEEGR
ncbi:MAG: TIGR02300 family protein [Azospirillum sp.]|nr:TIGR02300 family protein [Azospirillum sp.]